MARELTRLHLIPVASPAYLAGRPNIQRPEALAQLDGVLWRSPQTGRVRPWALQKKDGQQATVELKPRVTMSDPESLCRAVVMGLGVGLVGMPHALPYLRSGELVRLLPRWFSDVGAVSIYFAGTRLLPAKTRAFVDFTVKAFRNQDLASQLRADA